MYKPISLVLYNLFRFKELGEDDPMKALTSTTPLSLERMWADPKIYWNFGSCEICFSIIPFVREAIAEFYLEFQGLYLFTLPSKSFSPPLLWIRWVLCGIVRMEECVLPELADAKMMNVLHWTMDDMASWHDFIQPARREAGTDDTAIVPCSKLRMTWTRFHFCHFKKTIRRYLMAIHSRKEWTETFGEG